MIFDPNFTHEAGSNYGRPITGDNPNVTMEGSMPGGQERWVISMQVSNPSSCRVNGAGGRQQALGLSLQAGEARGPSCYSHPRYGRYDRHGRYEDTTQPADASGSAGGMPGYDDGYDDGDDDGDGVRGGGGAFPRECSMMQACTIVNTFPICR